MENPSQNSIKIDTDKLAALSVEAQKNAYCVYSNFPVGAALLCDDGTIFTGCNVENSSYGLGICAERTAAVKAVSEGHRKFIAIAVSTNKYEPIVYPCGACRQFLAEFSNMNMKVMAVTPNMKISETTLENLLPHHFSQKDLL